MKAEYRNMVIASCVVAFCALVCIWHFGPLEIQTGEDRILGSLELQEGDKLFLVAHRTTSLVDAYVVSLFRVHQKTNFSVCWLGHEDSYWWGSSLQSIQNSEDVCVQLWWSKLGTYSIADNSFHWADPAQPPVPTYFVDGVKVQCHVPDIIK